MQHAHGSMRRPFLRPLGQFRGLAMLLIGLTLPAAYAHAFTVSDVRNPIATGSVIDYAPYTWTQPGDATYSGMLIGNVNDTIHKAVLEFDISDLKPGVLESARIVGQVGPNNSADTGERSHAFSISAGNGVVDLHDNYNVNAWGVGNVSHPSGGISPYNFNITRQLRALMTGDPDYLTQKITPSRDPQGYDAVYSFSPAPTLELELRPTTAATEVYYQAPVATAEARATNGGEFAINTSATGASVMDWTYPPYEQGRALMEFDISSIPDNATIKWVKLEMTPTLLQSSNNSGPNLQTVGFAGDGSITSADVLTVGTLIGMSGEILSPTAISWDLDTEFIKSLLSGGDHLGLRLQPGDNPYLQAAFYVNYPAFPYLNPRLAIAYEVPEPAGLILLLAGTPALLRRRR